MIQLYEAPLEAGVQSGGNAVLTSLRQRLAKFENAEPYQVFVQSIENNPTQIPKTAPGIDPTSYIFRTITVTLTQAGYLPQ